MKMSHAGAAESAISHQTVRLACASSLLLLLLLPYTSSAPEEIRSLAVYPQMWAQVRRAPAANEKMLLGGSKRSPGHPWTEANLRRRARLVHRGFVVSIKVGSLVEACGEIVCDRGRAGEQLDNLAAEMLLFVCMHGEAQVTEFITVII